MPSPSRSHSERKKNLKEFLHTIDKEKEILKNLFDTLEQQKHSLCLLFESLEKERKELEDDSTSLLEKFKQIEEKSNHLRKERENWMVIENKLRVTQCKDRIKFDVGGCIFATSAKHLQKEEGSYFSALLSAAWDRQRVKKEEDDVIFIDRDPFVFRYVLSALRGELPDLDMLTSVEYFALRKDAEFYQMKGLLNHLNAHKEKLDRDKDRESRREIEQTKDLPPKWNPPLSRSDWSLEKSSENDFSEVVLISEKGKSVKKPLDRKEKRKSERTEGSDVSLGSLSPKRNFRVLGTKKTRKAPAGEGKGTSELIIVKSPRIELTDPPSPPLSPPTFSHSPITPVTPSSHHFSFDMDERFTSSSSSSLSSYSSCSSLNLKPKLLSLCEVEEREIEGGERVGGGGLGEVMKTMYKDTVGKRESEREKERKEK